MWTFEIRNGNSKFAIPCSGLIAVVGRANVGKSTLLNTIVGEKVSIVSPVAQTTRSLIRAILTEPRGQLAFLDTPGVHKASYDLGRMMNRDRARGHRGRGRHSAGGGRLRVSRGRRTRAGSGGWCMHESPCVVALNKADKTADLTRRTSEEFGRISARKKRLRKPRRG